MGLEERVLALQQRLAANPEPTRVQAIGEALKKPIEMEGRAAFLPFRDTPQGREPALPGVLA